MRRIGKFLSLPLAAKGLLVEALALLALARMAVLMLPFRWVAKMLGRETRRSDDESPIIGVDARRIGIVMRKASQNVPWTSKCLDQALAAKIMLARRGLPTTVYFGVKRTEEGELAAHAWLRSGNVFITGGRNRVDYTTINTFIDEGAR